MTEVDQYRDLPGTAKPGDKAKVLGKEYVWRTHTTPTERFMARSEWQWWPVDMSVMENVLLKERR